MRVNRMNVDAMSLLAEDRGYEAAAILKNALSLDPKNPYTLNNLGVAEEAIGDDQNALKHYKETAEMHSTDTVVVAVNQAWRGKPISTMAAQSASRLEKRILSTDPAEMESTVSTLHGVLEANRNDWRAADHEFLKAYSLYPNSAFTLNNRAVVAEREGDLETAKYFYEKARKAIDSGARVGLATQGDVRGKDIAEVAGNSGAKVDNEIDKYSQERRKETGPVELTPRASQP
jgi:Flp pilus assembly protein TadD